MCEHMKPSPLVDAVLEALRGEPGASGETSYRRAHDLVDRLLLDQITVLPAVPAALLRCNGRNLVLDPAVAPVVDRLARLGIPVVHACAETDHYAPDEENNLAVPDPRMRVAFGPEVPDFTIYALAWKFREAAIDLTDLFWLLELDGTLVWLGEEPASDSEKAWLEWDPQEMPRVVHLLDRLLLTPGDIACS